MSQATVLRHSPLAPAPDAGTIAAAPHPAAEAGHRQHEHDHTAHGHSGDGHDHAAHRHPGPVARHPTFSLLRLSLRGRLGIVSVLLAALWAAVLTVLG